MSSKFFYQVMVFIVIIWMIYNYGKMYLWNVERFTDHSWENKYDIEYNPIPYQNKILPRHGDVFQWNTQQTHKIYGNKLLQTKPFSNTK